MMRSSELAYTFAGVRLCNRSAAQVSIGLYVAQSHLLSYLLTAHRTHRRVGKIKEALVDKLRRRRRLIRKSFVAAAFCSAQTQTPTRLDSDQIKPNTTTARLNRQTHS